MNSGRNGITSVKPVKPMKLAAVTAKRFRRQTADEVEAWRSSISCRDGATARWRIHAVARWPIRSSSKLHTDVLDLRVARERLQPFFAPVAALLVPAERQLDAAARAVGVHVYLAGLDARCQRQRFVDVARPDAGDEPELAPVGELRRLVEIVEVDDRQHWAEDLFLCHTHVG